MINRPVRALVTFALASAALAPAGAQDPRIGTRLDAPSRAAITALVDSARAQGIPVEPLMEKVYEGMGKGADGPRIVAAVRSLTLEMASAHRALGTIASADEIKAAASAMHAGVPAVELGKLKKQSGLRRSLTLPFTVLADIVSRGVPVQTAANAIRSLMGAGAKDADINKFQRNVRVDIEQGAPPAAAAETRAKAGVPATKPEEQDDK
ncbi:MAG: hypothetical protein LH467_00990 [Gemmatimonadaceae bacterium]|nr:hypothetical protein [Gemmatimonadaceae bacterium]